MGTLTMIPEPTFGKRLIPHLIDKIAQQTPRRCYCCLARSTGVQDGFREITYGTLANAINFLAWWIGDNIGRTRIFETVAYMGPPDLRYVILVIASQKAGYKARRETTTVDDLADLLTGPLSVSPK